MTVEYVNIRTFLNCRCPNIPQRLFQQEMEFSKIKWAKISRMFLKFRWYYSRKSYIITQFLFLTFPIQGFMATWERLDKSHAYRSIVLSFSLFYCCLRKIKWRIFWSIRTIILSQKILGGRKALSLGYFGSSCLFHLS